MKTIKKYLPLLLTGFVTCATCNTTIAGMSVTGMSVKSPMDESVSKRSPDSEKTYQPCKLTRRPRSPLRQALSMALKSSLRWSSCCSVWRIS